MSIFFRIAPHQFAAIPRIGAPACALRTRSRAGLRHNRSAHGRGRGTGQGRRREPGRGTGKKQKEPPQRSLQRLQSRRRRPTLPHCGAVPSARPGLTSLFGMGRGGTPGLKPPKYAMCLSGALTGRQKRREGEKSTECELQGMRRWASKADGLLVLLGFDVAAFTPAAYRRRSLRRPCET